MLSTAEVHLPTVCVSVCLPVCPNPVLLACLPSSLHPLQLHAAMLSEAAQHGDVMLLPIKDKYSGLTNKTK